MSEIIKPKLNLRPSVILSEKSPPPTGLKINHGKPNFTICRTKKSTNKFDTTDSPVNNNKTTIIENFQTLPKKLIPIKNNKIEINGKSNDSENNTEFLLAHKKIHDKIMKENIKDSANMEMNRTNSSLQIQFEKFEEKRDGVVTTTTTTTTTSVQSAKVNGVSSPLSPPPPPPAPQLPKLNLFNKNDNGKITESKQNGHSSLKPAIPEKPTNLQNYKATSPTILNGLKTPPPLEKAIISSPVAINNDKNNGVNYAQKTVVSFSKDLSSEPNKYPDTVKVAKTVENGGGSGGKDSNENAVINELAKLKFQIAAEGESIVPVIRNP